MPWKYETDPYRVWISEIILQQTKVEQGLGYYNRFIINFPTVFDLAKAEDAEVFKMWEGLGYYNRCKNLLTTARHLTTVLDGIFPSTYEEIIKLKGIGEYTASAIASFVFNLPRAVVDGNVYRLLTRVFGIKTPIDTNNGKAELKTLAAQLLDKEFPGIYNQAIMDFGAIVCKPKLPLCEICPLKYICYAFRHAEVHSLPVKSQKLIRKERWLYYIIIRYKEQVYIRKRTEKDIWQNLYEFPLLEKYKEADIKELTADDKFTDLMSGNSYSIVSVSNLRSQLLTHQIIRGAFITISIPHPLKTDSFKSVSKEELSALPLPKFITAYLKD